MSKTLARMKMEFGQGNTPPPGWNPDRPWDMVWARVLRDRDYWSEQVYMPAARGKSLTPMEEEAKCWIERWTSSATRGRGRTTRQSEEKIQQGEERSKKEEITCGARRIGALEKQQEERRKRWRWKRLQRKGWKSRGRVLRLEQWERFVRGASTGRKMQRESATASSLYDLQVSWTFKFLFCLALTHGDGSEQNKGKKEGEEAREAPDRSGIKKNADENRGTKRKLHAGEDPPDDDDPRPERVHYGGDFVTFEEFVQERTFLFVHQFSGETGVGSWGSKCIQSQ